VQVRRSASDITVDRFLARIADGGLTGYALYEGAKYGRDKRLSLTGADIFVLPTYYPSECFPLVLLEAMQCGLPVVSTYEGGIPDIVEHGRTGYLCPNETPGTGRYARGSDQGPSPAATNGSRGPGEVQERVHSRTI